MTVARPRIQQLVSAFLVGISFLLGFAASGWGQQPVAPAGGDILTLSAQRAVSRRQATQAGWSHGVGITGPLPRQMDSLAHERMPGPTIISERIDGSLVEPSVIDGRMIHDGEIHYYGDVHGHEFLEGVSCGDCGSCSECCLPFHFENLSFVGGVHGNTGPRTFAGTGVRTGNPSFGFHEGLNWGTPVPCFQGLGMQIGAQFAQSNFSGAQFTTESRRQIFLTGGVFQRVDCGFQFGLVHDYLYDEWYSSLHLTQLRGEASWIYSTSHELGFWFTASTNRSQSTSVTRTGAAPPVFINETWEATDLYAFFYRYRDACTGANGRLFAGFTGQSDGLIGADLELPISSTISVRSAFTYLIPDEGRSPAGAEQESWNVGVSIVWRPCGRGGCSGYYDPLFNVADNGSFLLDRR